MTSFTTSVASLAVCAAVLCLPALTVAQPQDTAASTPGQIRKAQRKAARTKKNAELKQLEQQGYQPGEGHPNYPADIQSAERKAKHAAPQAVPASAP
ncbi:uncharacterized protein DUF4148 [Paraburkholderia sp. BL25I1N1]|nr:DUF4148 domain-containing protein [Paraburkholderia sp. BL25I1N1]PRY04492.1 uncharacterized protein DUF4148 [Paraburkholderia sp. BL25I1N1]